MLQPDTTAIAEARAPRLQAPIVLVHGLLGYHEIRVGNWEVVSYFPGIAAALRAAGNRVLMPWMSPTCGIADRARQLSQYIERELPGEPIHLIAHSMGGLDCRYAISRLGLGARVLTLTTVATPHRGSPFADWGVRRLARLARPLFEFLDIPYQAFYDLTTENCRRFNDETPDVPGVRYFSVGGQFDGSWRSPEWQLPYQIVRLSEGPNDGLVSLHSASYGEGNDIGEGDHLSLINWKGPVAQARGTWVDRTPQYLELVRRLASLGF
ncbi:MAG: lipase family alpha/beta hydrolase [Gemmataceae bacterium]